MPLRICHITTVHPAKDARIFYRMCRELGKRGFTVVLIAQEPFEDPLVQMSSLNQKIGETRNRVKRIFFSTSSCINGEG